MRELNEKKRLIPYMFTWTQTFLGILLILNALWKNGILQDVIEEGAVDRLQLDDATATMLVWMEDASPIDSMAEWSWPLLKWIRWPRSVSVDSVPSLSV